MIYNVKGERERERDKQADRDRETEADIGSQTARQINRETRTGKGRQRQTYQRDGYILHREGREPEVGFLPTPLS